MSKVNNPITSALKIFTLIFILSVSVPAGAYNVYFQNLPATFRTEQVFAPFPKSIKTLNFHTYQQTHEAFELQKASCNFNFLLIIIENQFFLSFDQQNKKQLSYKEKFFRLITSYCSDYSDEHNPLD